MSEFQEALLELFNFCFGNEPNEELRKEFAKHSFKVEHTLRKMMVNEQFVRTGHYTSITDNLDEY